MSVFSTAGLLGYAYLLEGDWQAASAWAVDATFPHGWAEDDRMRVVATGLLLMGLEATGAEPDDVLAQELRAAPKLIREHGALLQPVARSLPAEALLDGCVHLYERLIVRAIGGKKRESYAVAARFCTVIRSIRGLQGRMADFERYYQNLFVTYSRYSALKEELRTAIDGPRDKRRR